MVYLKPRFVFLAALVAAAAIPSFVLQSDARAVGLVERHHGKSHSDRHSASELISKGKGKALAKPVIPLPPSAKGAAEADHGKGKKHGKGGRKNDKRDFDVLAREADPKHYPHHHHHHGRQESDAQVVFSLNKRARSRIYGKQSEKRAPETQEQVFKKLKAEAAAEANAEEADTWDPLDPILQIGNFKIGDGRDGSFSDTHHLLGFPGILKRSPHHHHHHDHYDHHEHDKVIVNGDHDDVHVHERRGPHHHHHHDHHDHYDHEKVVVNGNDDKVHVHKRAPHHHHDHHEHHDHHDYDKTVINGNNDDVHVHERDISSLPGLQKRSDAVEPGVPGTVDIMNVDGPVHERLASLILSSVSDNSTTNGTLLLNGTKSTADAASPFVLDASNSTSTQFLLVVSQAGTSPSTPGDSLAKTLSALKDASSNLAADSPESADIKVTLQVSVFEPTEAAMRQYCATFDPNPPAPAPLYMTKCFDSNADTSGKLTEASLHESQTFAYNPISGIVRPEWFGVTAGPPIPMNSTNPATNATDAPSTATNSTSNLEGKQMNFKFPTSVKDAPTPPSMSLPAPIANVTQTVNGTAAGAPVPSPQNVTLVFTPNAPAVHAIKSPADVPSFEPAGAASSSASMSSETSSATSADSSNSATTTESANGNSDAQPTTITVTATSTSSLNGATSDAVAGSMTASVSASNTESATPTMTIDEAAIEKMYKQGQHVV